MHIVPRSYLYRWDHIVHSDISFGDSGRSHYTLMNTKQKKNNFTIYANNTTIILHIHYVNTLYG